MKLEWIDYFIIATYLAQLIQICFFSVPSAGSTFEILFKVRKNGGLSKNHPAKSALDSIPKAITLIAATLTVLMTSLIPLVTIVFPQTNDYFFQLIEKPPQSFAVISILLMSFGNALTLIAAGTLRTHVTFYDFGETTQLHKDGIYGYLRNPITLGLASIFAGFLFARPSLAMLAGFFIFLLNSNYRIKMEEVYLERAFGDDYLRYKNQVARYFPNFF
jgi:protein-S-isoprenylcysteine O-methyltransferase Ste14